MSSSADPATPPVPPVRRVGLLGGTFDPPHLGHLVVADAACEALGLTELRLLVAGEPWMKQRATAAPHRVRMARLATDGDPRLSVDDRETRRSGPTYTVESLVELRAEEPGTEWVFLLGADAAVKLPQWHRAQEALAAARFVVLSRPGHDLSSPAVPPELDRLEVPRIGISSTALRARVAAGASIRYQVPEPVLRYIHEQALYRSGDGDGSRR